MIFKWHFCKSWFTKFYHLKCKVLPFFDYFNSPSLQYCVSLYCICYFICMDSSLINRTLLLSTVLHIFKFSPNLFFLILSFLTGTVTSFFFLNTANTSYTESHNCFINLLASELQVNDLECIKYVQYFVHFSQFSMDIRTSITETVIYEFLCKSNLCFKKVFEIYFGMVHFAVLQNEVSFNQI